MPHYKSYADRAKPAHCLAECVYCGKISEKRNMKCLMLRKNGWATPKVVAFICPNCVCNLYEHLGVKERDDN